MTVQLESPLTIKWENRGSAETPRLIGGYSIDSQYLTSTDEFEVKVYDSDPVRLRQLLLEPVELALHGEPILVGRIERIERGNTGGAITLRGRDYLSDLVECNIDPSFKASKDDSLVKTIKEAAGPVGIRNVLFQGYSEGADKGVGDQKPDPGQGIYDFLNRIAARSKVTLQPTTQRNAILIDRPDYTASPSATLRRSMSASAQRRNNIVSATSSEDATRMPTVGLTSGKVAETGKTPKAVPSEFDVAGSLGGVAPALGATLDGKVATGRRKPADGAASGSQLYRLLYVKDDKARTEEQIVGGITRAVADRLKDTLVYSVKVNGHKTEGGELWRQGMVVQVQDETCDVEEPMWVCGVRFSYERGGGSTTDLTCWRLGAFIVG